MTFGGKIRELRKKRGMTQEQLSELVGVHTNTISQWENGVVPHMENILKLAKILDTTSEYLTNSETTDPPPNVPSKVTGSRISDTVKGYSYIENLIAANKTVVYEAPNGGRVFIPMTPEGIHFYEQIASKNPAFA